jgi:hypothetical protein
LQQQQQQQEQHQQQQSHQQQPFSQPSLVSMWGLGAQGRSRSRSLQRPYVPQRHPAPRSRSRSPPRFKRQHSRSPSPRFRPSPFHNGSAVTNSDPLSGGGWRGVWRGGDGRPDSATRGQRGFTSGLHEPSRNKRRFHKRRSR